MSTEVKERETFAELAELCNVDEPTIRLWLSDTGMFEDFEIQGKREVMAALKGYLACQTSMTRGQDTRIELNVGQDRIYALEAHELPLSCRKLADLLEVSHQTVLRTSAELDHKPPFDANTCSMIADVVLGETDDESGE